MTEEWICPDCFGTGVDEYNEPCSCDWRNDVRTVRRARRAARLRLETRRAQ